MNIFVLPTDHIRILVPSRGFDWKQFHAFSFTFRFFHDFSPLAGI